MALNVLPGKSGDVASQIHVEGSSAVLDARREFRILPPDIRLGKLINTVSPGTPIVENPAIRNHRSNGLKMRGEITPALLNARKYGKVCPLPEANPSRSPADNLSGKNRDFPWGHLSGSENSREHASHRRSCQIRFSHCRIVVRRSCNRGIRLIETWRTSPRSSARIDACMIRSS